MKSTISVLITLLLISCSSSTTKTNRIPASGEGIQKGQPGFNCGDHPFERISNRDGEEVFKKVKAGIHGFMLNRLWEEDGHYYAHGIHFSAGLPHHMFSALLKFQLDEPEYRALQKAQEIHESRGHDGGYSNDDSRFAPFIVLSRRPMKSEFASHDRSFCMVDLPEILNGGLESLYGDSNGKLYGNIRQWNPQQPGIFDKYDLEGLSPVIEFDLPKSPREINDDHTFFKVQEFGDITRVFYDPHRPAIEEFDSREGNEQSKSDFTLRKFVQ